MTEPAGGKITETDIGRYRSTRGLDYESVPWKLWEKSKKLFWDPADIDFSHEVENPAMAQRETARNCHDHCDKCSRNPIENHPAFHKSSARTNSFSSIKTGQESLL